MRCCQPCGGDGGADRGRAARGRGAAQRSAPGPAAAPGLRGEGGGRDAGVQNPYQQLGFGAGCEIAGCEIWRRLFVCKTEGGRRRRGRRQRRSMKRPISSAFCDFSSKEEAVCSTRFSASCQATTPCGWAARSTVAAAPRASLSKPAGCIRANNFSAKTNCFFLFAIFFSEQQLPGNLGEFSHRNETILPDLTCTHH